MPDEAPTDPGTAASEVGVGDGGGTSGTGEFERYALLAALTLVVLCLLIWDRWHDGGAPSANAPPPDRTLRVRIGGDPGPNAPAPPQPRNAADIPPAPRAAPTPPAPAPLGRTYTVKSGDTLGDVARRELGSAARAGEIAKLNSLTDPSKLNPGQVLRLPAK